MSIYYQEKTKKQQYLYVISGFCEAALNSVERLDFKTMEWKMMKNQLNIPRTKF